MMGFNNKSEHDKHQSEHDYYLELCALSTSGTLDDTEWSELKLHLADCTNCRNLIQNYRELARTGMALLISLDTFEEPPAPKSWSPEIAKRELFTRVARGENAGWLRDPVSPSHRDWGRTFWVKIQALTWRATLEYAAVIIFSIAAIGSVFQFGINRGQLLAHNDLYSSAREVAQLRSELNAITQEKTSLDEKLRARTDEINQLSREMRTQADALSKWKALQKQTKEQLDNQVSVLSEAHDQTSSLSSQRDAVAHRLEDTQAQLVSMRNTLDHLREERANDLLRAASLETRIEELSSDLRRNEVTAAEQKLVPSDRDIRELMGARDLYIADVFDVDLNGRTRKPFGRVFYTRGKSLIFYAFDLDQPHGVRSTPVYQAWGRRGINKNRPVNMGTFYLDSETNERWILKYDNPEALAQIDAVFVTGEPKGGSEQPRGRQLLFASLRTQPNHP